MTKADETPFRGAVLMLAKSRLAEHVAKGASVITRTIRPTRGGAWKMMV